MATNESNNSSANAHKELRLCQWCGEVFHEGDLHEEADLGLLCETCIKAICSRGENIVLKSETEKRIPST